MAATKWTNSIWPKYVLISSWLLDNSTQIILYCVPGKLHLFEYAVIMKRLAPSWHLIKISKCLQSPLSGFKTVELFSLSVDQKLWQVMCHTKSRKSFRYALSEKKTKWLHQLVLKSQSVCPERARPDSPCLSPLHTCNRDPRDGETFVCSGLPSTQSKQSSTILSTIL